MAWAVSESSSARFGQQFVRFDQLGIEFERLRGPVDRFVVEAVGADEREAEIGLRVLRIPLQRFLEEALGVGVIEALVQQQAPADAIQRVAVATAPPRRGIRCSRPCTCQAPEAFGAQVGIARLRERFVAGLRLGAMAVLAQRVAIVGRGGQNARWPQRASSIAAQNRALAARASLVQLLLHLGQLEQRGRELAFVIVLRHRRFLILQRVDLAARALPSARAASRLAGSA